MSESNVLVTVRIPAVWSSPQEMIDAMPDGCRLTPDQLILDDGTEFAMDLRDADDQFVGVFASMCRREPTDEEKHAIENYTVQLCLTGPGGSIAAAARLMHAASLVLQAGGAGVFIDNSGVAMGGTHWQELTAAACGEELSNDAISFAFIGIIGGAAKTFTTGMQILGLPDVQMKPEDISEGGSELIEMMQYLCDSDQKIEDGHIVADLDGPRFQVQAIPDSSPPSNPMHNPWGRLQLISVKDIAERN